MSNLNLWQEWNNVRGFAKLPQSEKNRIIDLMKTPEASKAYWADTIILELHGKISESDFIEMGTKFLTRASDHIHYHSERSQNIIEILISLIPGKIRNILHQNPSKLFQKMMLLLPNLTIDEEVLALRALSTSKYLPNIIFKNKYRPRLEALDKLPPVMRLKTLEGLVLSGRARYNMFPDIDPDSFKALMFPSSLKHTDRVKIVSNKYDELKHMGEEATMKVSGHCEYCGLYSIQITTEAVRTLTGIQEAYGFRGLVRQSCPMCGKRLVNQPNIERIK